MSKLPSILIAAGFAAVSAGSFAASHGGAIKDDRKQFSFCLKKTGCGPLLHLYRARVITSPAAGANHVAPLTQ